MRVFLPNLCSPELPAIQYVLYIYLGRNISGLILTGAGWWLTRVEDTTLTEILCGLVTASTMWYCGLSATTRG